MLTLSLMFLTGSFGYSLLFALGFTIAAPLLLFLLVSASICTITAVDRIVIRSHQILPITTTNANTQRHLIRGILMDQYGAQRSDSEPNKVEPKKPSQIQLVGLEKQFTANDGCPICLDVLDSAVKLTLKFVTCFNFCFEKNQKY